MCVLVCFCLDSICGGDSHKSSRVAMFPRTIIGSSCFGLIKQNTRFIFPTFHRSGIHNETTTASSQELSVSQPDTNAIVSQSNVLEPKIYQLQSDCLKDVNTHVTPVRQVWVENMSTPHSIKLGLMELHPSIFSAFPRPDVIQENHRWQTMYKHVDWTCMKTRAELSGTGAKPWPQKGLGRARHGSRRAPMWIKGGWAVGPRGPKTYFYMLPHHKRVAGLIATLSAKFSQNDIHVVDTFETFPLDGTTSHLEELCETRRWGPSVLFVDQMDLDEHPQCTKAEHFHRTTEPLNYVNVIPVYGLNVFSMLKHETLVLTTAAVNEIQNRLLFNLIRTDLRNVVKQYKPNPIYKM